MTDRQSTEAVDTEGTGPPPGPPDLCLLHLNLQPCPWCADYKVLREAARAAGLFGEVEAATIDTTPRKRRGRPPGPRR